MTVRFPNRDGEVLAARFSEGSLPCVVLLHGFGAYKDFGIINDLYREFVAARRCVFAVDFSGNGESQGSFGESTFSKQARDVADALNFLQREHGIRECVLVGHSMGGAVALLAADDQRVRAVVSLAGPMHPEAARQRRPEYFSVGNEISVPRVKGVDLPEREYVVSQQWMRDAAQTRPLAQVPDKPVLAIHGERDSIVPVSESEDLQAVGAQLLVLDTDHHFSGLSSRIREEIESLIAGL